jgi:hypothetical protein
MAADTWDPVSTYSQRAHHEFESTDMQHAEYASTNARFTDMKHAEHPSTHACVLACSRSKKVRMAIHKNMNVHDRCKYEIELARCRLECMYKRMFTYLLQEHAEGTKTVIHM